MKIQKILGNINLEKFFKEWCESEAGGCDNFEEYIGVDESELEAAEEDSIEEYADKIGVDPSAVDKRNPKVVKILKEARDKICRVAAETWYFDRIDQLEEQMERICDIREDGLVVYRELTVEDSEEFIFFMANGLPVEGFKGIGTFWAWDKRKASPHWGRGGTSIILTGLIPFSAVDKKRTLELNLNPALGEEEAEIRLIEGREVEIIKVDFGDTNESLTIPHGIKVPA